MLVTERRCMLHVDVDGGISRLTGSKLQFSSKSPGIRRIPTNRRVFIVPRTQA